MPDRQPVRLPLVIGPENRDETTNRDARLVNGFLEKISEESVMVFKRPGLEVYSNSGTPAAGLGIFYWEGAVYAIWGDKLFKDNVAVSGTVDTTNGVYSFSSCLGGTPKLFMNNGVKAYTYDTTNGLVQVTDTDFPSAAVKGSAYLDGTTYVMDIKANIYGSAINDPQTWDPTNLIKAQIEPDGGVALAKQLVYVVAFKEWSVEVFYDAGNATGSPLASVQGAKVSVGCRSAGTLQEMEGTLFWVAQARSGSVSVMAMTGLKAIQISTAPVDRLLEDADFAGVKSWTAKMSGHKWYGLTVPSVNKTLVYDVNLQRWYEWTDTSGNYLRLISSTFSPSQHPLVQHSNDGIIYNFEDMMYTDNGELFSVDLYTPNYDGGTRLKKYMLSIDFIGDQTNGSIVQIRKSDDDYQTWSNFRNVDMSTHRPRITQCGSFRRRAHHLRHRCNTPFRIQALEMQIELGTL